MSIRFNIKISLTADVYMSSSICGFAMLNGWLMSWVTFIVQRVQLRLLRAIKKLKTYHFELSEVIQVELTDFMVAFSIDLNDRS